MMQNNPPGRFQTYSNAGKQLFQDVMYLKSMINAELHLQTTTNNQSITNAGSVIHASAIAQGNSVDQRDGEVILPRCFEFRATLARPTTATTPEQVRLVVFRWYNTSTPTVTDVLETADVNAPYQRSNQGSLGNLGVLQILCDRKFVLGTNWQTILSPKLCCEMNDPRSTPRHIHFNNNNTTAEIGGLYWLIIGQNAVAANQTTINYYTRLHWYDN
jgi:hypothetical protein